MIEPVQFVQPDGEPLYALYAGRTFDGELMQFTGMHDDDGNDIYEGDIVQFRYTDSRNDREFVGVVEWDTCNPCFVIQDPHDPNRTEYDFIMCGMAKLKRIGNIREDPELLQQTKATEEINAA